MPTMTSYPHGVPSWIDLATPDPASSKDFYAALFGWQYDDQPTDQEGSDYTMARRNGRNAAGMMRLSPEMAASGMPPVWSTYVNVDDIEVTVAEVQSAGGAVMRPPMDVMDAGRMAVIADPASAVICLWQAGEHIGAEVVNEHGAFSWSELITPDPAAVAGFYEALFGWTTQTAPMPNGDYTVFHVPGGNENGIAGAMAPPMAGMPAHWGVYFNVDDAAVDRRRRPSAGRSDHDGRHADAECRHPGHDRRPPRRRLLRDELGTFVSDDTFDFDAIPRVTADPTLPGTLELGAFSLSLAVADLGASVDFYSALGFVTSGGDAEAGWLILRNGETIIGLFHGMFERNMLDVQPRAHHPDGTPRRLHRHPRSAALTGGGGTDRRQLDRARQFGSGIDHRDRSRRQHGTDRPVLLSLRRCGR